jgi:tRNA G18 (ribose-2'-O)-methylase SpoU
MKEIVLSFLGICLVLGFFMFIKIIDLILSQSHNEEKEIKVNVIDSLQDMEFTKLRKLTRQLSLDIHLVILNVRGDIPEIGMMVRSAMALGVSRIFIIGRKKWDKRTSVGSHHYMDIVYMARLHPYILRDRKVYILEQGCKSLYSIKKIDKPITLVVGNESTGVPNDIKRLGTVISIPQVGIVRSLNVSSACSIALSHFQYQFCNQYNWD